MQVLKFGALQGHLDDAILEGQLLVHDLLQGGAILGADLLLALRTLQIIEDNTRPVPLLLHLRLYAIKMHDVSAVESHARLLANGTAVANGTVVVFIARQFTLSWHLLDALGIETR